MSENFLAKTIVYRLRNTSGNTSNTYRSIIHYSYKPRECFTSSYLVRNVSRTTRITSRSYSLIALATRIPYTRVIVTSLELLYYIR